MFLKKVPLKRKNSEQVLYYYKIVESFRDEDRKPKHRLIAKVHAEMRGIAGLLGKQEEAEQWLTA